MQSGGCRDVSYFCNYKIWLKSCVFCGLMRKFARDWRQWWEHSFSIDDVDEDGDNDDDDNYYYYYYFIIIIIIIIIIVVSKTVKSKKNN